MLKQSHPRSGTDSNLPRIKRNKLRFGLSGLGTPWSHTHKQSISSLLLQTEIHEGTALMETQISGWT